MWSKCKGIRDTPCPQKWPGDLRWNYCSFPISKSGISMLNSLWNSTSPTSAENSNMVKRHCLLKRQLTQFTPLPSIVQVERTRKFSHNSLIFFARQTDKYILSFSSYNSCSLVHGKNIYIYTNAAQSKQPDGYQQKHQKHQAHP